MPDQPEQAKTPAEFERDAQRAEEAVRQTEEYLDPKRLEAERAREQREYDEQHALGDALMGLVGAGEPDELPVDSVWQRVDRSQARQALPGLRERATRLRAEANWARRAIASTLMASGALLAVGGAAGVGNTQASGATAAPASSAPTSAPATAGASAAAANLPPTAGPITAVFRAPQTSYTVQATDPEGQKLTYTWTRTNTCGQFTAENNVAVWNHPDIPGGCPAEDIHPGTITVVISDGANQVQRVYTQGSAPGTGTVPATATATPLPTTTSRTSTPTATATPTSSPGPDNGGGPNGPLVGGGIAVAAAGAVLLRTQEKKKTCDREREEEERTRAEMDRKKAAYDEIDRSKSARDFARGEAARADANAKKAAKGVPTGGLAGEPVHFIGKGAAQAQAAADAAQAAHDDADIRQKNYDAKGGDAAWQQAKSDYEAAKAAHDAAAAALAACLGSIAPPGPTDGGGTDGGGTTSTGGGTTVDGGTRPPQVPVGGPTTQSRVCTPGTRTEISTSSATINVPDPTSTKLKFEADAYPVYIDLDATLDWAESAKGGLSKAKSALDKLAPGVAEAMEPMGPVFDVYDKLTDAAIKGLRETGHRVQLAAKTGTLKLHYRYDTYQLTCKIESVCNADGMGTHREATCTKTYMSSDGADIDIGEQGQVFWDGSQDSFDRQKADAMNKLWTKFNQAVRAAEARGAAFRDACK